jgi:hypothetical protein
MNVAHIRAHVVVVVQERRRRNSESESTTVEYQSSRSARQKLPGVSNQCCRYCSSVQSQLGGGIDEMRSKKKMCARINVGGAKKKAP